MDLMKLLGTVIALLFHPGSLPKTNGQRICRRGTERPCYKVSYIQDSRRRLTFDEAAWACRADGGDLLSIESESEQRLMERFIQQLRAGDGDFWIGLRRSPQQRHRAGSTGPACPSQYYWLDGSKAKFRNWHWDEPSCGSEMCAVLYHQPSALPDEGHFLFQWSDDNCNSKNNFVCKYPKEKIPVFTEEGNTAQTVPSVRSNVFTTTESGKRMKIIPESSVSLSDDTLYVSYILYATIPALLLLLLAVAGFVCYKQRTKRRKSETETYPCRSKPWLSTAASPCPVQGPYAFSDISKLPELDGSTPTDIMTKYFGVPSHEFQCDEYENVSCTDQETGFVTNDIYEICRAQTGWVDNEIYG